MRKQSIEERFWAKVSKNGPVPAHCPELGQCWVWIAGTDRDGYGKFTVGSHHDKSHRVIWKMNGHEIPGNLCVLHRCDNPPCVRISYLFLGSQGENVRDRDRKGRGWVWKCEASANAKLTNQQVLEIKRKLAEGARQRRLAAEYGVSTAAICLLANGKTWRHVNKAAS
jgi:hypothetical protein